MEGIGKFGLKIALVEKKIPAGGIKGNHPLEHPGRSFPPNPPKKFGLTANKIYVYVYVY